VTRGISHIQQHPRSPRFPPSGPFTSAWWTRTDPLPGTADMPSSERLLERATMCANMADAVRLVAAHSSPGPAYSTAPVGAGQQRGITVPRSESGYVLFRWRRDAEWDDAGSEYPVDPDLPEVRTLRLNRLLLTLSAARMHGATPQQQLQIGDESLLMANRQTAVAVAMWWDDRMAEGHTPESARFLLALTLSPAGMAMLHWPEPADGAPARPVWGEWPVTVQPLPPTA
jgi:hypothetical protein